MHLTVIKRDGTRQPVSFDQISDRIRKLSEGLENVNSDLVAQKVCSQLSDNMETRVLDEFAAEVSAMMQSRHHPNYGILAARILIDNHHKNTPNTLLDCVETLYHEKEIVSSLYHDLVCKHADEYQKMIDYSRDFMFDYFGFKTLERAYLLKKNGVLIERPQHMWMRVAIQLHESNFTRILYSRNTYSIQFRYKSSPVIIMFSSNHER